MKWKVNNVTKLSIDYFKKYKLYYVAGVTVIIAWFVYLVFFWNFYHEMYFWVDKDVRYVVQLIFISSFYLTEIMIVTTCYFLLLLSSLFLLFFFFFKNIKEVSFGKSTLVTMICFGIVPLCCSISLLVTLCWPYFLAMLIASFAIVYITYAITKYLYEDNQERYTDKECIKEAGPFSQREEAETYSNEFISYWMPYFKKQSFTLVSEIKHKDKGYLVEIYTSEHQNEFNSFS
ncbi:hypothetical protein UAW_02944 [Enterococcus haemoperoxidus ATCC BAA-382]|uniref:Uncharacterized protein n=1 Tax=Enterococcus haemoperoxidus ATCC BAA-382 TaxID=1158608 RepID=R2QCE9_9ENTE|nr:hypothetical protein UAW_02944 [Enterococcus haemoperoxidus ATCC BAA-382]EOT61646.1 hypothetical protein I583_00628 [Enterococcus haemoperoxidus ATCC BAA-382]OJG55481.1 hypothetical protein RV06_GL001924 [Enterococcus haemoperoxidus]